MKTEMRNKNIRIEKHNITLKENLFSGLFISFMIEQQIKLSKYSSLEGILNLLKYTFHQLLWS